MGLIRATCAARRHRLSVARVGSRIRAAAGVVAAALKPHLALLGAATERAALKASSFQLLVQSWPVGARRSLMMAAAPFSPVLHGELRAPSAALGGAGCVVAAHSATGASAPCALCSTPRGDSMTLRGCTALRQSVLVRAELGVVPVCPLRRRAFRGGRSSASGVALRAMAPPIGAQRRRGDRWRAS